MKRILMVLCVLLIGTASMAQENTGKVGKFFLSPFFDYGVTYSGGEIEVDAAVWSTAPELESDLGQGFGVQFGYMLTETDAFVFGIASEKKTVIVIGEQPGSAFDFIFDIKAITFHAGYKGFNSLLYYGAGIFVSSLSHDDQYTLKVNGVENKANFKDNFDLSTEFGFYLEAGLSIPVKDTINIDLGVKFEGALNNSIKMTDSYMTTADATKWELRTRLIAFHAGVSLFF